MVAVKGGESVLVEEIKGGDVVQVPSEGNRPLRVASVRREQIVGGKPMVRLILEVDPPAARPVEILVPVGTRVIRLHS